MRVYPHTDSSMGTGLRKKRAGPGRPMASEGTCDGSVMQPKKSSQSTGESTSSCHSGSCEDAHRIARHQHIAWRDRRTSSYQSEPYELLVT